MRIPTKFEIEQYKKRNKDIKLFCGVCAVIIAAAAVLLLIG